jgi:hypothetical protein
MDGQWDYGSPMSRTIVGRPILNLVFSSVLGVLLSACAGGDPGEASAVDIPGLDPEEEIELVEIEAAASDDSYIWLRAFEVEGLAPVNVGHVTPEFLEAAHRLDDDPEAYQCLGNSGSGSCEVEDDERPALGGLTFGGPDTKAWTWQFVPDDAVAIRFTDQDGRTSWQRPQDRLVIFPVADNLDADCACRLDAIDIDGAVIASVDIVTSSYTND